MMNMNDRLKGGFIQNAMLLLALGLLSGCTSSLHLASKKDLKQFHGGERPVYVTNPDLKREYAILKSSGIYQLTSEPDGARRLTLLPVRQYGRCGNPLMLTYLSLGIVPGYISSGRAFEYVLETDGATEKIQHSLPLYERVSDWEWLTPKNNQKLIAEALAWSALGSQSSKDTGKSP